VEDNGVLSNWRPLPRPIAATPRNLRIQFLPDSKARLYGMDLDLLLTQVLLKPAGNPDAPLAPVVFTKGADNSGSYYEIVGQPGATIWVRLPGYEKPIALRGVFP